MSVLAQGTHVFVIDPNGGTPQVLQIMKATSFNPGGAPASQIDETTLEDLLYRQYRAGLRDPGQATLGINADPQVESHVKLHEFSEMNPPPTLKFAIGWSDGTEPPTIDAQDGGFTLPTTRTWFLFDGYVSDFPFDFQQDTVVTTEVTIQRSGGSQWVKKEAA